MELNQSHDWKRYTAIVTASFLGFAIATFCVGLFFTQRNGNWALPAAFIIPLYLFVIFASIKRVVEQLPIPVLMIMVPIAPLAVLILVVSILPILQKLQ